MFKRFELNVIDGHTPCSRCARYIDTDKETFLALVLPDRSIEAYLEDRQAGRPADWSYTRGVNTYHLKCWNDLRDSSEDVYVVTGAGSSSQ